MIKLYELQFIEYDGITKKATLWAYGKYPDNLTD